MRRTLAVVGVTLIAGLVAAAPLGYRSVQSTRYRNFRVVEPGVLLRSGQMSPGGLQVKATEYGVRTVVSLRGDVPDDGKPAPDTAEGDWCRANGVEHVVLTPMHWRAQPGGPPDAPVPVEDNLRRFVAVMANPAKRPVLVHCFAGIHRTGGYVALYRMEFNGWTADEAIAEMVTMGTARTTFDDEIPNYLRGYTRGKLR